MLLQRKQYPMKCDIQEKKDRYLLDINLPGFQKENLKAYVENGYLIVSATQDEETKENQKKYVRCERYHGELTRSFYIGEDINQEDIRATYQHGVLKLVLPKKEEKAAREKEVIQIA